MTACAPFVAGKARPPQLVGIGGIAWSGDPAVTYSTLLGSCIAICMWDPIAGKGGLIHFLLARAPTGETHDTRYGEVAMPLLVRNLCAVGCSRERLQVTVAGGADVLSNMQQIGTENTAYALEWLRNEGFQIVQKDFGGTTARRVRFNPSTGQCLIQQIDPRESISSN